MGKSNVNKNNGVLDKNVLLRRCLTIRKDDGVMKQNGGK